MPRLGEQFMEQLRNSCEVEQIIGEYVALKRRGKNLVGLCPFHGEKTASFTVFPETQSYYCFGCGAGGDVINFIGKIENLDYVDAAKFLADRAGIAMPETRDLNSDEFLELKKRVFELNKVATNFFFKALRSPEAKEAVEYVKQRRLTAETLKKFAIGYAPNSFHALTNHLAENGYSLELAHKAGLCGINKDGKYYDLFRNRLMFPIFDVRGNVIAFGGRVIVKDEIPKYLNSSDTPVFKKSRNLFSLNNAKGTSRSFILAEGYMDVISLYQAGFHNAVATLGTAITEEQAALLKRYADEIVICYDADEAGKKATDRAIQILSKTDLKVRVLRIDGGKDPDEFIKAYGAEKFALLLKGSGNKTEYMLSDIRAKYSLDLPDDRLSYLKECAAVLARLKSPIEKDLFAGKLADELSVSKTALLAEISSIERAEKRKNDSRELAASQNAALGRDDKVNAEKKRALQAAKAEECVLCSLFYHPELYAPIASEIEPEAFVTKFNAKLYALFLQILESGAVLDTMSLGQYLEEREMGSVIAILSKKELAFDTIDPILRCKDVLVKYREKQLINSAADVDVAALESFIRNIDKSKGRS